MLGVCEVDLVADENPYRSPNTSSYVPVEPPRRKDKSANVGCLVLFLITLFTLDMLGPLLASAGSNRPILLGFVVGGFVVGAALGAYVSVRFKHEPWWSAARWAIGGLSGVWLAAILVFNLLGRG